MNTTPDFRALCAQLLAATQLYTGQNPAASEMSSVEITEKLMDAMAVTVAALATPPPESPTSQIRFNAPSPPEEVIRLDKEGFYYKGQFVADAGEAHRLMMAFFEQNTKTKPEPPTDDELLKLTENVSTKHLCAHKSLPSDWDFGDYSSSPKGLIDFARAVLEMWG